MKRRLLRLALLATVVLTTAAPLGAQEAEEGPAAAVPEWQMKFENLSPEDRESYRKLILRASSLFNQKRIFEALNSANDAEKIFDNNPAALNLKGACYVEFRDFEKARVFFNEALALSPESTSVLFNLAEMDFVTGEWQKCHDAMSKLLPLLSGKEASMKRLIEFKLMLSMIKLGKIAEARELASKYTFLDDTPYYYYAQASIEYQEGDSAAAERWLASARRVFRNPEALAPWQDTLIEFGYIKSFYGGDLEGDGVVPRLP